MTEFLLYYRIDYVYSMLAGRLHQSTPTRPQRASNGKLTADMYEEKNQSSNFVIQKENPAWRRHKLNKVADHFHHHCESVCEKVAEELRIKELLDEIGKITDPLG